MVCQCLSIAKLTLTQVTNTHQDNIGQKREIINMAVILQLQEGQKVWLRPDNMSTIYGATFVNGIWSWFCGYLVYAM